MHSSGMATPTDLVAEAGFTDAGRSNNNELNGAHSEAYTVSSSAVQGLDTEREG